MQHLQKTGGGGHCYPRALRASRRGVPLLISHPFAQYPPCFAERVLNVPTLQPANLQTFGSLRGDLSPIPHPTDHDSRHYILISLPPYFIASSLPQKPVAFPQQGTTRLLCKAVPSRTMEVHADAKLVLRVVEGARRTCAGVGQREPKHVEPDRAGVAIENVMDTLNRTEL